MPPLSPYETAIIRILTTVAFLVEIYVLWTRHRRSHR